MKLPIRTQVQLLNSSQRQVSRIKGDSTMATITVSNCQQQLSINDLDDVEKSFDFRFPESLKRFYLLYNGGMPNPSCFQKDNEYWQINEFLSIKYGEKGNLF